MAKTLVIKDSSINELVLGGKHIHYAESAPQYNPETKPEREVEDVSFEEVSYRFPYITPECIKKGMVAHVENHLRVACSGSAEALWKCIHEYETMGYLSTANVGDSELYRALEIHFGALPYGLRNFSKYRYPSSK